MRESVFTYGLSRPYPFVWFTPVVVLGTVIGLVIFSIINFASTGYTSVVEYSKNPNVTTSQAWFQDWPSLMTSKVRPTCQSANIPLNTKLLTNNTALTYTLTEVRRDTDGDRSYLPSLVYFNNPLLNCTVDGIQLDIGQFGRTAAQIAMATYGLDANANVVCKVETEASGNLMVNLTANYNLVPGTASIWGGQYRFQGRDRSKAASLYWGESLLSVMWAQTAWHMTNHTGQVGRRGYVEILGNEWPGSAAPNGITDLTMFFMVNDTSSIQALTFFELDWRLTSGNVFNDKDTLGTWMDPSFSSIASLSEQRIYPDTWISGDAFAKAFYSTILVDLG